MASLPGDRNYRGPQNDPYADDRRRAEDDRPRRQGSKRPTAGYWDARDEERMHRAQADFDYQGRGQWDEQLGGYRYTQRNYPEERYAARSAQGRDYGPRPDARRAVGERYRPRSGDETTGRGYTGEVNRGYAAPGNESPRYGGQGYYEDPTRQSTAWYGEERLADGRRPDYAAGKFRGRGPAGYRRSDERIREDVNDWLTDDPFLDASGIEVKVENGEVTLEGAVNTRACRRRAENLVEQVSGVTHVQNNLRVQPAPQETG